MVIQAVVFFGVRDELFDECHMFSMAHWLIALRQLRMVRCRGCFCVASHQIIIIAIKPVCLYKILRNAHKIWHEWLKWLGFTVEGHWWVWQRRYACTEAACKSCKWVYRPLCLSVIAVWMGWYVVAVMRWTLKDNIEPYLVDVGYLRLGMLRVW